ncbi:PfkB family carbohydrate kinase [Amycolatopsis australiensis]|uniref:RfaE bifunctional protein, domain I/rfaE bifunctional protein, domain II n=1 Tax=Amycolatopsis australiensis TaxID=546364 RepID=A0A1K1SKD9_9PSEU|nr:PfkB family carbohydrate kinase [Amycolatopsis australiensis]SFW84301.1 rfaE bifunctional protein, domain I/rfaE bifunctional protein, domain II [Amycolatopsis australiensis]
MKPLVVLGDTLLDVDAEGTAERLCPEAPVPVVDLTARRRRPGGAGLAALLAARSATEVVLVTPLGDDEGGHALTGLLEPDVTVLPLPLRGTTVCKTRVRASGQSLVRLDSGDGTATAEPLPSRVRAVVEDAGAILVADYGRGLTRNPDVRALLRELAERVPVVWDPHPRGAQPVPGTCLATPNLAEARAVLAGHDEPAELAKLLRGHWHADAVAVTVGARGAVLADGLGETTVPVPAAARAPGYTAPDTCGAGDRFAAAATAALLGGADAGEAVTTAVEAAARFVAAGGATALSTDDGPVPDRQPATDAFGLADRVRETGGRLIATGGCFDLLHPGHVSLLRQARALGDALVVCLNSDASVRALKGPGRPLVRDRDRARLLTALSFVDAVAVFDEPSPTAVLERLRPHVWVKGGDYAQADLPEREVVERHGGEVVLVPTVPGYSTSRLVAAAASA